MLASLRMSGVRSEPEAETKSVSLCLQVEAQSTPDHQHLQQIR